MKYKVNEIFYSVQGEGHWVGTPMVFIRFSGCNLKCSFCDTSHETFKLMDGQTILSAASQYPAKRVLFTGGEPTLQLDDQLLRLFIKQGYKMHVETNGTSQLTPRYLDWVTVSPKENWVLKNGDELKVIYTGQNLDKYTQGTQFKYYYLQPQSNSNILETVARVKAEPAWKLSLQMHKLIDIS